jgi:hypothetical protein
MLAFCFQSAAFAPAHTLEQAMALAHSPGVVEVACNLLDPGTSPPQVRGGLISRREGNMPTWKGAGGQGMAWQARVGVLGGSLEVASTKQSARSLPLRRNAASRCTAYMLLLDRR